MYEFIVKPLSETYLLILFLFIPALSWSKDVTYTCNYAKSYEANFEYPKLISVVVDFHQQSLVEYKEDGNELTGSYYCERCSSTNDRVDIWTKKYTHDTVKNLLEMMYKIS